MASGSYPCVLLLSLFLTSLNVCLILPRRTTGETEVQPKEENINALTGRVPLLLLPLHSRMQLASPVSCIGPRGVRSGSSNKYIMDLTKFPRALVKKMQTVYNDKDNFL